MLGREEGIEPEVLPVAQAAAQVEVGVGGTGIAATSRAGSRVSSRASSPAGVRAGGGLGRHDAPRRNAEPTSAAPAAPTAATLAGNRRCAAARRRASA